MSVFTSTMSYFWAPSTPVPEKHGFGFKLRRRWSELELVGPSHKGRYEVNHECSPKKATGLVSLCAGRRRSKTEPSLDLRSKARFRVTRGSPDCCPYSNHRAADLYEVSATLLEDRKTSQTIFTVTHTTTRCNDINLQSVSTYAFTFKYKSTVERMPN